MFGSATHIAKKLAAIEEVLGFTKDYKDKCYGDAWNRKTRHSTCTKTHKFWARPADMPPTPADTLCIKVAIVKVNIYTPRRHPPTVRRHPTFLEICNSCARTNQYKYYILLLKLADGAFAARSGHAHRALAARSG